jgi:beta-galactosidase/arabinogalactan endo-1,4-beta-galactosidase
MKNYSMRASKRLLLVLLFGSTGCISLSACAKSNTTHRGPLNIDTVERIIGADVSFLPQLEAEGKKFYDHGVQKDGLELLKYYKFNYIRLRIFVDPAADSGYSVQGYCGLQQTLQMAKRIKAAGMKFLLDFHYSDNWADPGKQYKPSAWKNLSFPQLTQTLHDYTKSVLESLQSQNTPPDMVQIGNEINHGILWPDGNIVHRDSLAALLKAGIAATRETNASIKIMLHIADGGDNTESRYFIDNMMSRGVQFDILGESYYPRWHGTTQQLQSNLTDLSTRYKFDVIVAEYSEYKREVNDIAESIPNGNLKGTFIWEPFSWGETVVDTSGNTNALINIYPAVAAKYNVK